MRSLPDGKQLIGVTCTSMTNGSYGMAFDATSHLLEAEADHLPASGLGRIGHAECDLARIFEARPDIVLDVVVERLGNVASIEDHFGF